MPHLTLAGDLTGQDVVTGAPRGRNARAPPRRPPITAAYAGAACCATTAGARPAIALLSRTRPTECSAQNAEHPSADASARSTRFAHREACRRPRSRARLRRNLLRRVTSQCHATRRGTLRNASDEGCGRALDAASVLGDQARGVVGVVREAPHERRVDEVRASRTRQ